MRFMLLAGVALFLTACGGGSDTSTPVEPSSDTASTPSQAAEGVQTTNETPAPAPAPSIDLSALPAPYNSADYNAGRREFRRCSSCHTLTPDGGSRVGPNLHGMFGRAAGSAENFNYSDAVLESGIVWTPELLDAWLANPREFLPGNRMSFVGLRDEEQRRDVIAYLMIETAAAE